MAKQRCRFCNQELTTTFVDLGMSPLSNSFVTTENVKQMEPFYPLHAYACENCFLVQLEEFETPKRIFTDYAYFSSYSDSWLLHASQYADMIISRLRLTKSSFVIEIASNDGYLLQYFKKHEIPVLGIEPAENVAKVAIEKGIDTLNTFFNAELAEKLKVNNSLADLIICNNVLAHVPNLNDFVASLKKVLKPKGVITLEFPHLLKLIKGNQFDTIYHEHFSYFSLYTVQKIFHSFGLDIFDVEEINTHGGSLRVYVKNEEDNTKKIEESVGKVIKNELEFGINKSSTYQDFSRRVIETKRSLLKFFIEANSIGKSVIGYGAPAKGNTLLNYCGVRTDFIEYTVDKNIFKQGKYLPGIHIPIYSPEIIRDTKPDYILILPWNLKNEIMEQLSYVREWGGKFIIPIPEVTVV